MVEDEDQRPKPAVSFPRNLEGMSIEALEDYLCALDAEAARVKQDMAAKRSLRGAADRLFKG